MIDPTNLIQTISTAINTVAKYDFYIYIDFDGASLTNAFNSPLYSLIMYDPTLCGSTTINFALDLIQSYLINPVGITTVIAYTITPPTTNDLLCPITDSTPSASNNDPVTSVSGLSAQTAFYNSIIARWELRIYDT